MREDLSDRLRQRRSRETKFDLRLLRFAVCEQLRKRGTENPAQHVGREIGKFGLYRSQPPLQHVMATDLIASDFRRLPVECLDEQTGMILSEEEMLLAVLVRW